MASVRKLKKELTYLTGEIISNCKLANYFQGTKATEDLAKVISKAIEQHNSFRDAAINAPKEGRKQYFAKLNKDIIEKSDALFEEISSICQKQ